MFVRTRPADTHPYAYLLGAYLGDGYVANTGRTFQLVITLDAIYPDIVEECRAAIVLTLPATRPCGNPHSIARFASQQGARTGRPSSPRWGRAASTSARSSSRRGSREIVESHPWPFVRGVIHSDGCRTVNRFKTRLPSGRVAEYAYPRYFFSNLSADIRGLFCDSCERLGLRWTQSNHRNISISHRTSVALLDENVGPKC